MAAVDFLIIGAGIAGASVATELIRHGSVLLLEAEKQPGFHTTGRSAGMFMDLHRDPEMRALVRCSRPFFNRPPEQFTAEPLLSDQGVLIVARKDQLESLTRLVTEACTDPDYYVRGDSRLAASKHPGLKPGYADACLWLPEAATIDVHALLHGFLNAFRRSGGRLETGTRITSLRRSDAHWVVQTEESSYRASVVVNAAGAWAEQVGQLAGAQKIGLVPKRRSMCVLPPGPVDISGWPMLGDVDEHFYFKPEGGNLLLSPADETVVPPGDAQADDLAIAEAVAGLEAATAVQVRHRITRQWAGLRSFVEDRLPVVGYDSNAEDFFWLAGQGGDGIQTAPALARLAAALAVGAPVPDDLADAAIARETFSPARLGRA